MISTLDVLAVVSTAIALYTISLKKRREKLPPGPHGGLFGDNRSQIPATGAWRKFAEWSKQYGPVISFYLGRTPVIVLNTLKSANELLDKRGEIYSSRPRSISGQEILSGNLRGLPTPYGDRWRRWRKTLHIGMMGKNALTYREFQTLESSIFLRDLVERPDAFTDHIVRYQVSVTLSVSYGRRVKTVNDWIVRENRRAGAAFLETHTSTVGIIVNTTLKNQRIPGRFLVDSWPIFLWLPKSLQWFRYGLEKSRRLDTELYMGLLNEVKEKMEKGIAKECMTSRVISTVSEEEMDIYEQAYAMSAPFAAGVETVVAAIHIFLLAMLHNPDVAKKAQDEIFSVVGHTRPPGFEDEDSLPYIKALVKEVLRWKPATPTGIPHSVTQDDYYEGYLIPKRATVYVNIAAMCLDPDLFPDPERFMPERFLYAKDPQLQNFTIPFGFGRRICAGMEIADQLLFIVIARTLWAFDILPVLDELGSPKLPDVDAFIGGTIRRPVPFSAYFNVKSTDVRRLILSDAVDAEEVLKAWD